MGGPSGADPQAEPEGARASPPEAVHGVSGEATALRWARRACSRWGVDGGSGRVRLGGGL